MGRLTPFLDDFAVAAFLVVVTGLVAPGALPWVVPVLLLWFLVKLWMFRAHLRRPAVGPESMPGRAATALTDLAPRGHVDLDGEVWRAEAAEAVAAGERVVVLAVEGLTLRVARAAPAGLGKDREPRSLLLALARRLRRA